MINKEWGIKCHVQSSMANEENGFSMFLGRWQPLHDGHKQLFQQEIDKGKNVCIMIRHTPPSEKNPYHVEQVRQNIITEYRDLVMMGKMIVIIVPNITSIHFGRGVGYDIIEHIPPAEIAEISATKIRESQKK